MADFNKLPNAFLIGAAKSGTTSLANALAQHPSIYLPSIKEPQFFSSDRRYERGLDWYSDSLYKDAGHYPVRLDASTHYLYWGKKVAQRLKAVYGARQIKIMAIFREPVARTYSLYWHFRRDMIEDLSFEEALAREGERLKANKEMLTLQGIQRFGYVQGSRYATNLKPFLAEFPREQFLFHLQEDLYKDFEGSLRKTFEFLGVDPNVALKEEVRNRASLPRYPKLQKFILWPSGPLHQLARVVTSRLPFKARARLKHRLKRLNLKETEYPELDSEVANKLKAQFKSEIVELEKILDRDLSHWY